MNNEEKLKRIFNDNPDIPKKYVESVDRTLEKIMLDEISPIGNIAHIYKYNLKKLVAGLILGVISVSGTVFASVKIYNSIWKNPEKYDYVKESVISEKESESTISDEMAKSIAKEWFEKLGYYGTQIKECNLEKDPYYEKIYWKIQSVDNNILMLNAYDGSMYQFGYGGKLPTEYMCNKNQAIILANEIYLKLGFKEEEYVLRDIYGTNIKSDGNSLCWDATFYKVYDNIYNEYQRIALSFIPEINQIIGLTIIDNNYEDNPIVISEQEAIEIAKEKDLSVKQHEVKEILTELRIENMNEYIYLRENNYNTNGLKIKLDNGNNLYINQYRNSNIYRKVWNIHISYEDNEDKDMYTEYFIDTTTGEVIGGRGAGFNENKK